MLDGVKRIDRFAFYHCRNLSKVTIPESVTHMENSAFSRCFFAKDSLINHSALNAEENDYWYADIAEKEIDGMLFNGNVLVEARPRLTSANIPEGVTTIDRNAFYECFDLTSVTIPESVTSIGSSAFSETGVIKDESNWEDGVLYISNCLIKAKTEIKGAYTIREGCRVIADNAFGECDKLSSVTIPNSVTHIGSSAFSGCRQLSSITLPGSVTNIGQYAFSSCSGLTTINLPNSVMNIGDYAFSGCSGLTSITIPSSVTSVGNRAFRNCLFTKENFINHSSLSAEENNYWEAKIVEKEVNGLLISNDTVIGCRPHLATIIIPEEITTIADYAFSNGTNLSSITIPNTVMSIESSALTGCTFAKDSIINHSSLNAEENNYWGAQIVDKEIDRLFINDSTIVGYRAPLDAVTIPKGVKEIPRNVFLNCTSLTSITIGNDVTHIAREAFRGCTALEEVVILDGVTTIDRDAFIYCTGLKEVSIGNGVKSIGRWMFSGCTALEKVTLGNGVTSIGSEAFEDCVSLPAIVLPDSITTIESSLFRGCSALKEVGIGNRVTSIESNAFTGCSALEEITIPQSVESIGVSAFYDCSQLKKVNIGTGVTSIGTDAFLGTAIYNNPTNWQNGALYIGDYLIKVQADVKGAFSVRENCLLIANNACYKCSELTSVAIPNSVKKVGVQAFRHCTSLTSVAMGNGLTDIGEYAFSGCSKLSAIVVPDNVTAVRYCAFEGCTALTSAVIGNGVTLIGWCAFFDCTALTTLTLGKSLETVGESAFKTCTAIDTIYCYAPVPPEVYNSGFKDYSATLCVPCSSLADYQSHEIWGLFAGIQCIDAETPTDLPDASSTLQSATNTKFFRNGQLVIVRDGVEYNVMGQKI